VLVRTDGEAIGRLAGYRLDHGGAEPALTRRGKPFFVGRAKRRLETPRERLHELFAWLQKSSVSGHSLPEEMTFRLGPHGVALTGQAAARPLPGGCEILEARQDDVFLGCRGSGPASASLRIRRPHERARLLVGAPPGRRRGHWAEAYLSPGGGRLLLRWTGPCATSRVYLAPAEGGALRLVTPDRAAPMGWSRDGHAIVLVGGGRCGAKTATRGVYAVDPSGRLTLLARGSDAILWHL
jgi:hypothetical protein